MAPFNSPPKTSVASCPCQSLTSWVNNQTINPSWIEVRDGATVDLDTLASLSSVNLVSAEGGTLSLPKLTSYSGFGNYDQSPVIRASARAARLPCHCWRLSGAGSGTGN